MFVEVVTQDAVPAPRTPTQMYNISSSSAAVTSQEIADFIGRTPKFKFGQYKGENFGTVCRNHPDYYFWATSQKKPSQFLLDFMDFVQKNYEMDVTAKSLTLDVHKHLRVQPQMSDNPQERPMVTRSKSLKYAKVPQCEQCTDFSGVGSNSFVQRRTCKVCGTVYQNKTEKKDYQNPNLCPHEHLTRQGSSKTTCRIHCSDCNTYVSEEPRLVPGKDNPGQPTMPIYGHKKVQREPDTRPNPKMTMRELEQTAQFFHTLVRAHIRKVPTCSNITQRDVETILQDAIDIVLDEAEIIDEQVVIVDAGQSAA